MLTVFWRTVLIYLLLLAAMRIMGKRQIGELELSELITTLMLSELATGPIGDPAIPLSHAIIPIATLLALEVAGSVALIKFPAIRHLLASKPSVLIEHGVLKEHELRRIRMSLEELLAALRQQGVTTVADVDYAILETNGRLSAILRGEERQPTVGQLALAPEREGIAHILIADGIINHRNLARVNRDEAWLTRTLRERGCLVADVFLLTLDDSGEIYLCKKEKK